MIVQIAGATPDQGATPAAAGILPSLPHEDLFPERRVEESAAVRARPTAAIVMEMHEYAACEVRTHRPC